ncbi:MAG: type II toxin-antitoxin system RelE/ParE family toxin [Anaerolineales bacterium]|nr:type II toxin-antitoxin system RelE/ParE family toxin [Anaerolineales bacterium]
MYQVKFTPAALDQLERLDKSVSQQVFKKLRWLAENFDESTPIPLTGNLKNIYKLRVGNYRALYTFSKEDTTIVVHFVEHRSNVYKTK